MEKSKEKLSVFISLILRHKPEKINIQLDKHGWADVNELLDGIRKTGRTINMELLEDIVATDNKKRYSFNDDRTKIRANQGHSISVDVELTSAVPPKVLYHGTAIKSLDFIKEEGITSQSRQYVHLSNDIETAKKVGARHGASVVLIVKAHEMYQDGYEFWISENKVWLCKSVPIKYIKF